MLKSILTGIAVAGLAMTVMYSNAFAGGGVDVLDFIEIEGEFEDDEAPDCSWIRKQVREVGSTYWKVHYREECLDDD